MTVKTIDVEELVRKTYAFSGGCESGKTDFLMSLGIENPLAVRKDAPLDLLSAYGGDRFLSVTVDCRGLLFLVRQGDTFVGANGVALDRAALVSLRDRIGSYLEATR